MQTAQKIISDPANANHGEVQHHRIAAAAEKEQGVEIKGTRNRPYFKFTDGSSLSVDHIAGNYSIKWPRPVSN